VEDPLADLDVSNSPALLFVAGAVLRSKDGILLTRRPKGSSYEGHWELPGGKVEADETAGAAIVREMWEELEVAVRPIALHSCGFFCEGERTIVLSAVEVRLARGVPRSTDGREMQWVRPDSLKDLPFPPADLPILDVLRRESHREIAPLRIFADVVRNWKWNCRTSPDRIESIDPRSPGTGWRSKDFGGVRLLEWRSP